MGTAFSRGELELTMEGEEHESSSAISVRVEAVKHDEQPGGLALHTSAIPEKGSAVVYRFNHLSVVVHEDGTSQLFDTRQLKLEAIESV